MAGKLAIKPFKAPALMDSNNAKTSWKSLEIAFNEIYKRNSTQLSFEFLYRLAYNLVVHKHGEILYNGVSDTFHFHTKKTLDEILKEPDEKLLVVLLKSWEEHRTSINMIKDVVMYMNGNYVKNHKKLPVYECGLSIFRNTILYNSHIRNKLHQLLLLNIENERNGEIIDITTMKGLLSMLLELSINGERVYENEFENLFLYETKLYYEKESNRNLSEYTCIEYIQKVELRFQQEHKRIVNYLSNTTELKLMSLLETELISNHANTIIFMEKSGCEVMLHENNVSHLKQLCQLFQRVPIKLQLIRDCISEQIKKCGYEIISDQEKTKDKPFILVERILELKEKFDHIISVCLQNEQKSLKVIKESFEEFINKDNRTAVFLALYIDDLMKSGAKELTETEIEDKLDKVILIFRYLNDKDIFETYYKNFLSKRLLGKGVNDELERIMISKLKTECGYQFTSKLEGMFTDIRLSKSTMEDYMKVIASSTTATEICPFEFDISILTAGFWPSSTESQFCQIPAIIRNYCVDPFSNYYFSRLTGRKLSWQYQLGSADLKGNFSGGKREISVSTYQMFILLLFNDKDTYSLNEVRQITGIPETELRRHLLSLCTPKFKILSKQSKIKGISDDEIFTFNDSYTSKLKRVKIPLISLKEFTGIDETDKSMTSIPASVEEDRRHLIEATIVRIMKARKILSHNDLLTETMRQSSHRFVVDAPFIKKRVESLIEREYLSRDKDDRRIYHYQA